MLENDQRNVMLDVMEGARDYVAACTGLRQQFIDAGWHEHNAERMVYAMLMQGAK